MQLGQILCSVDCGSCITEVDGETFPLVWANPRFEEMTGYDADALSGRDPWFLHTGLCPEAEATMKRIVSGGRCCRGIIQIRRSDGVNRWVEVTGRPARQDGDPRLFGMIDDWGEDWQQRFQRLTPLQERLFSLTGNGATVQQAAGIMGLSRSTAYRKSREILRALEVTSLTDLYLLQR